MILNAGGFGCVSNENHQGTKWFHPPLIWWKALCRQIQPVRLVLSVLAQDQDSVPERGLSS